LPLQFDWLVIKPGELMDIFDFEELMADILDVTDEQRDDDDYLEDKFYQRYGMDLETGFALAKDLITRTPIVDSALATKKYHAFIDKDQRFMLMKVEAS